MVFVYSIVYAIIAIISWVKNKKNLLNPVTVIFTIWAILLPFTAIGLFEVPPVSSRGLLIIFIGLFGFLIGSIISGKKETTVRIHSVPLLKPDTVYKINYPFLYILYIVSTIYLVMTASVAFRLMRSGYSLDYIRELVTAEGNNELRSSTLMILVKNFIATPTVYLSLAILPIELLMGKKNKVIIGLTLIMTFCWVISSGGRSIILWLLLYFIATFIFSKYATQFKRTISKNFKKIAIVLGCLLVVFLLWSTFSRKGKEVDLFRQIYIYYIAPIKHFDVWIEKIDNNYNQLIGYGGSSFYGFIYPFLFLSRILTGASGYSDFWVTIKDLSFSQLEHTTWLGGNIHMNAFVTMFYQPYIDGRLWGVFALCLLFGFVCKATYKRAYKYRNVKYILLYLLFLQKIVDSMVRFYYTQTGQAFCLLYALIAVVPSYRSIVFVRGNRNESINS